MSILTKFKNLTIYDYIIVCIYMTIFINKGNRSVNWSIAKNNREFRK